MKLFSEIQLKDAWDAGGISALRMRRQMVDGTDEHAQSFESFMMETYPELNINDGMVKLLSGSTADDSGQVEFVAINESTKESP